MLHFFIRRALPMLGLGLGLTTAARAQSTAPTYSNEFMNLGAGARSLGMGKVQVSLATDATAGYWNPAALTSVPARYDGVLMHSELFSGIVKYDYGAFAMPLDDKSAVGVTLLRSGVDNIADTRNLINEYGYINYDQVRYFSVADYGLLLSYARKLGPEGLSLGASGKIIYRSYAQFANAYGFGVDVGAQYNRGGWRLGLAVRDITTTYNSWTINADEFKSTAPAGTPLPSASTEITLPRLLLGVGRQVALPGQFSALLAADFEVTTDGARNTLISDKPGTANASRFSVDPRVGLEVGYRKLAFLRGGLGNYQRIKNFDNGSPWKGQYSLGAGVAFSGLRVDLAVSRLALDTNGGSNSQTNSLIVSLGYGLGSRSTSEMPQTR